MSSVNDAPTLLPPPPVRPTPPRHLFFRTAHGWLDSFGADAFELPALERRLLWRRNLVVSDPAAIRHVFLDNAVNYTKTAIARRLLEPGLGKGLITLEGEAWRRHRKIMAPAFDPPSIAQHVPAMVAAARDLGARWTTLSDGTVVDMVQEMRRSTLAIIARTMFSADSGGMVDLVAHTVERYVAGIRIGPLDLLGLPDWFPRWLQRRNAHRAFGDLSRAIAAIIDARRHAPGSVGSDLLGRLIAARTDETGAPLPEDEIQAEFVTIFMAGHETTALALSWTWYLLALHPEAHDAVEAELARVLGGRDPEPADVPRLTYTRMAIDEALRLYPPAHTLSRQALGPDEVAGHRVAKSSIVFVMPWILHRHRRLWDAPEKFRPERFSGAEAAARPRFAYLPFGAGPRVCIGASFALTEAVVVLATLAQRFRPRLVPGVEIEPAGLITLRPKNGMPMTLTRR
ncbi:MAG TPA: cytochrome P450 [Stellaceae bacterium]|nr:cytochrome P450 [Stellaceae bacterium]